MSYYRILPYGWVKENGSQVFFALGVNDVSYYTEQTKEIINLAAFQREVTKIRESSQPPHINRIWGFYKHRSNYSPFVFDAKQKE